MYGYVYESLDKRNDMVYIGQHQGSFNPEYRGGGIIVNSIMNKYGRNTFIVKAIDWAKDKLSLDRLETAYISSYRIVLGREGMYNIANGGDGGRMPPEVIERMRQASLGNTNRRGKPQSEEAKEKQRVAMSGRKYSDEVNKKKGRSGELNVSKRLEVRDKISKALSDKPKSLKHRDNLSKALTGYKRTQESIDKGVASRKGYRHTQETIEKIRKSNLGKRHIWKSH